MAAPASLYVRPSWNMDWEGPAGAAAEANALLAQIAPRTGDYHTWLHCFYEPGERWQPVERLMVAEMTPRAALHAKDAFFRMMGDSSGDELWNELEGPDPADAYFYDAGAGEIRYRSNVLPPSISRRQWLLWREQGAFANIFWIVQGSKGGHKRDFTLLEKKILKFNGLPSETPFAGELPFARFDQRIVDKIEAMNKLNDWMSKRQASWETRTAEDRNREKAEAEVEIEDRILSWVDSQITDLSTRDTGSNRTRVA